HLGREADADLVRPPRPAASRGTAPAPGVLRLGRSPRRNRSHPHRRRHRLTGGGGAMNDFLRRLFFLPEQASSVAREFDTLHYFVIGITMVCATGFIIASLWCYIR